MGVERIPISAAREIAKKYGQSQVILVTWERGTGVTHVVTYGKSLDDCKMAARGGNFVKKALGWPDNLRHAKPSRQIRDENKRGEK